MLEASSRLLLAVRQYRLVLAPPAVASNLPFGRSMAERTLLIDDAARALGVSRRTVYYRIREGKLLTIRAKCGSQRVLVSSIERLLRAKAVVEGLAAGPSTSTGPDAGV